jgi:hypothetical protein
MPDERSRARRGALRALLTALLLLAASAAPAQQVTPPAPPLPQGDGTVRGRVLHPDGNEKVKAIPVVLYGLSRDGQPGVANTTTDAGGAFAFEGIANGPDIVYLVGARFAGIPFFGPRVAFEAGSSELQVEIEVSDPTSAVGAVSVDEVIVQLEWSGGQLAVQETHRLRNDSASVVLVPDAQRGASPAPFSAQLPGGATAFEPMTGGFDDAFDENAGQLRYWGPIYPGGQDLRFAYRLAPSEGEGEVHFALQLSSGAASVSVLAPSDGLEFEIEPGTRLGPQATIEIEGRSFVVARGADLPAGSRIALRATLPESRDDPSALSLGRTDLWVELDDTQLVVNHEIQLRVDGLSPLASRAQGPPLLRIPLPEGAETAELSAETRAFGASVANGALELRGPIPAGESTVRARYRLPATASGAQLTFRAAAKLPTLNVFVADTGVIIRSKRLHRRRPFPSGTRTYLHREAYQLEAGEEIEVELQRLERASLGPGVSAGLTLAAMFGASLFVIGPLRRRQEAREVETENPLQLQRDAVYQDIRDIDHDFETGKLSEEDHAEMRAELRGRAIELLRRERASAATAAEPGTADAPDTAAEAPRPGSFCPGCGARADADWSFCSACGRNLAGESGA